MCSHLVPRPNNPEEPDLGEYVETMDNIPLPIKTEEVNIENDTEEAHTGEYVETPEDTLAATDIKEEENQETKNFIDSIHPTTNKVQTSEEIVENGSSFIPTSVIKFFHL